MITLPCLISLEKGKDWGRGGVDNFHFFDFSKPYPLFTIPSKQTFFLTPCRPPTYCGRPQLSIFMGTTITYRARRIALHQANLMFLNNIVNTIRTRQRNNTNICFHIPKRDVFMRLLYNILYTSNLQWMGVSLVSFFHSSSHKQISQEVAPMVYL